LKRIASLYSAEWGWPLGNKRSLEFASAVLAKDAYALEFMANGFNDKSKKVFSEVTGVSLPKQQGATWKAIRDWAGVSDEQENYRVAVRDVAYEVKAFMRENNVSQEMVDKNKALIASKIAEGFDNVEKIGNSYWFTNNAGQGINLSEKPKKGYLGLSKSRALVEAMIAESKAKKLLDASAIQSQESIQPEPVTLTGKELGDVPTPPQDRPTDYRTNLESARAVAESLGIETKGKKLERLVMDIDKAEALPNRDELDPTKLAELGVATITSIGHAENIYIEKDGKQYFSKVGNPQLYALGEWDFAKYPEGKLAAPVTQPNNTLQKDISKSELFKDANVWAIDDFGKENGMVIYSRDEQDGFSIGIVDKLKQVNMQYTDIDTDQQTNESFSTENITNEQVIEKIKMFIAKHEQKSVELLPVQPVSEPSMTDFALVTFNAWKKGGKHRIYLKVSENDNAFNEMDYGANDLGYLEVVGKNGSEKINNLSTVSNYSKLKDKVIGSAFISALQEYLSLKDIDIAEFNVATLKVKIKSDTDVLAAKQAEWEEEANAEAQAKQAKQDKTDLQQAIIKENIAKFGRGVVVNDLSDAVLGNNAKVDAILAGTLLMSDKDFNSFLSFQKSAEPTMTNPDRDYLQSIIDGKADLSNADEIEAKLTDINERLDADLEPLFEQAAEAFAQYGIAQAAMN